MRVKPATVAIVGTGVVGCSVAWELAQHGHSVTLIDDHSSPFEGMSRAGFGSLTPYSDPYFTGAAIEHAARGVELYRSTWIPNLEKTSGHHIYFQDLGLLRLCETQDDFNSARGHASTLLAAGYKATVLAVPQVRELEPNLLGKFVGGIWLEDEPWLDIGQYYAALAANVRKHPQVTWRQSTKVCSVLSEKGGVTIRLGDNSAVPVDFAVVCTGLHPDSIDGLPTLPLRWIRGDAIMVCTTDGHPLLRRHVYQSHGFITPREDGRMLLGATYFEEDAIPSDYARQHRNRIQVEQVKTLIQSNEAILPSLVSCDICEVWRGWRATSPDSLPILGPIPNDHRIVLANGFIGLGVTMAPATAEAVRNYLMTGDASVFPSSFRPSRFMAAARVENT